MPSSPARRKARPAADAPLRFRHIERNQPAWMIVDLERMLDESHPARAIWDFVGGLDLSRFEGKVKAKAGSYPAVVIADGSYTNRKSIIDSADKGVEFIGSWGEMTENKPGKGIDPRFAPSAFDGDEATNEVICPMGKRLVQISIHPTEGIGGVYMYAAMREDCQACKKRKRCTPNNKMEKHGRAVGIRL